MKLTEDNVRDYPKPDKGQVFQWDSLVVGFGVRHTPTVAAYVIQWRRGDGSKVRQTIGRFPAMSVREAREAARKALGEAEEQKASRGDQPLRIAMRAWHDHQVARDQWRPRYADKVSSIISNYVEGDASPRLNPSPSLRKAVDELGRKSVAAVRAGDVLAVADGLRRGAADQFLAIVSSFYGHAMEREWAVGNPARNRLRKTGGRIVRNRRLTDAEFRQLWDAFKAEGDPAFGCFTVLAFTGCRRSEATGMRWSELDLKAGTWTIPPERRKTGKQDPEPFTIRLAPTVVRSLKRQPVLQGSPFVFWGRRDRRPLDLHHALMTRINKAVEVQDWRLHDLRRYVRSGMGALGIPQAVAEMCLGHIAKPGLVAVYDAHSYDKEKAEAWAKWARHLDGVTK